MVVTYKGKVIGSSYSGSSGSTVRRVSTAQQNKITEEASKQGKLAVFTTDSKGNVFYKYESTPTKPNGFSPGSGGINPATGLPSIAPPSNEATAEFYASQKVDTKQGASINERVLAQELARPGSTQTISQGFMQPGMVSGANVALAQSALNKPVSQRTYSEQVAIIQAAQGSQAYQIEAQRQAEAQARLKQQLVQNQPSQGELSFLNQQYKPKQPVYDSKTSEYYSIPKPTKEKDYTINNIITTPTKKDYSLGTFKGSQEQLSESQKIILSDKTLVSKKLESATSFLDSVTELFNPMEDFGKFDLGKGNVLPGVTGLLKTPSYVVGTAAGIIGGGFGLISAGTEYATNLSLNTGRNIANYYDLGKSEFKTINLGIKTIRLPFIATKNVIDTSIKVIPPTVNLIGAVAISEASTTFSKTRELGANIIGSTVKEAVSNPIKFGTELAVFEGAGRLLKGVTNIGALESKSVVFLEKGRGAKYLVNGKAVSKLGFKEANLINVLKYDFLKLAKPKVIVAPSGKGFVEGAIVKNFVLPSGKKTTLLLKDYPSQMIGKDISKLAGATTTGISVAPGKGTPFAEQGLKGILKLSKKDYTVLEMPGTSVLRKFGGGIERGQFFAPKTSLKSVYSYTGKGLELVSLPKGKLPQAYVYYAGVGREPSLVEALSSGRIGWGKSPKILVEEQKVSSLLKKYSYPATKKEVSLIKKEFASKFNLAKQVESGLVAKPTDFLSTSDLKRLLKRGTYEQYAVYRRLTTKLNVSGTVQPGVGAFSGLRTELETIKAAGGISKKIQVNKGSIRSGLSKVFDVGEVQIKYAPTKDVFGVVYQKNVSVGKKVAEKIVNKTNKADWFKLALRDVKLPKVSSGVKPIYSVSKRLGKLGALAGVSLSSAVRGTSVSSGVPKVSVGSSFVSVPSLSSSVPSFSFKSSSVPSVSVSISEGSKVSGSSIVSFSSVSSGSISKDISSVKPSEVSTSGSSGVSGISGSISGISSRVSSSLSGSSISSSFKSFGSSFKSFKSSSISGKSASISSVVPSVKSISSFKRYPKSSFKNFSSKTPSFRKDDFSLIRSSFSLPREKSFGGVKKFSLSGGREVNLLGMKEKYSYPKTSYSGKSKYSDALKFNDSKSMVNKSNEIALIKNDFKINNIFSKSKNYSSGFKNLKSFFKSAVKDKNRYSYSNDYSVRMKGYGQKVKYRDTDLFDKKRIL